MLCRNDILEAIHIFYDLSTTEIVDSCCDRIGISSTNYNRNGYLGTYKKEGKITYGRAQYIKTGGNGIGGNSKIGNGTLYWHAGLNVWIVGPDPGSTQASIYHQSCTGKGGVCPSACSSNWKVHNSSAKEFKIDSTLKMECLDCCDVVEVSSTVAAITGSYAKQPNAESGRDYYLKTSASDKKLYLYWTSQAAIWAVSSVINLM